VDTNNRSRQELINELAELRRKITELELVQADQPQINNNFNPNERRAAKGSLKGKYYQAFLNNPDMITITTLKEGRFTEINEAFIYKIGFERYEVIGHLADELGIWHDLSERNLMVNEIREKGKRDNFEAQFRTRDGRILNTLISADNIDVGGEPHLLCVIRDITEQKALQNEMSKLDRLNLVGEMAASIGHEIRNPITTVRGFLQMFEDKYSEDQEFLDLMIEELDRANFIITEYLSLAKDKMVELKPKNLNIIVQSILPLLEASARIQDKEVKVELTTTPYLLLDEKEIRQLILNLVHNGLEAMSLAGIITIKIFTEEEKVVLSIHDQGCGIEPEDLDKLGMPFFTTKQQGTGLGLAVCYGIAKRHNARIDVETSSRGTIIYVRFPMSKELPMRAAYQGGFKSF